MRGNQPSFVFDIWGNFLPLRFCSTEPKSQHLKLVLFRYYMGDFAEALVDSPCKLLCVSLCPIHVCVRVPANVCVIELSSANQPKPVISHVNAGLKAKRKISWGTYNNNTWKMEQSLFLQSSQARRGCLSLWEDVWLPPLYVCFGPLSWFCYTSTFSSKHVKIFHAH